MQQRRPGVIKTQLTHDIYNVYLLSLTLRLSSLCVNKLGYIHPFFPRCTVQFTEKESCKGKLKNEKKIVPKHYNFSCEQNAACLAETFEY